MQITITKKTIKIGDKKTKKVFLLFPYKIMNTWIWLETIKKTYLYHRFKSNYVGWELKKVETKKDIYTFSI